MSLRDDILDIIRKEPGLYGVEISDRLEARVKARPRPWWKRFLFGDGIPSTGAIYAALDDLEDEGLVTSRQGIATPERGGRRRLHFYPCIAAPATAPED